MCISGINSCGDRIGIGSIVLGLGIFAGGIIAGAVGNSFWCLGLVCGGIGVGMAGRWIGKKINQQAPETDSKTVDIAQQLIDSKKASIC